MSSSPIHYYFDDENDENDDISIDSIKNEETKSNNNPNNDDNLNNNNTTSKYHTDNQTTKSDSLIDKTTNPNNHNNNHNNNSNNNSCGDNNNKIKEEIAKYFEINEKEILKIIEVKFLNNHNNIIMEKIIKLEKENQTRKQNENVLIAKIRELEDKLLNHNNNYYPHVFLPRSILNNNGQVFHLLIDSVHIKGIILPYDAFSFHSQHKSTTKLYPILTKHEYQGSWKSNKKEQH
jgi:hypothetical protein